MSFHSQSKVQNYSQVSQSFDNNQNDSIFKAHNSPQKDQSFEAIKFNEQELSLSRTFQQQPLEKKLSRSFSKKNQQNLIERSSKTNTYVKQQHGKINDDLQDLHNLQQEIQRLQAIKTQYKTQKQSIQKLGQVVQKLKIQNQQLKKCNTEMKETKIEQNIPVKKNHDSHSQTPDSPPVNKERHFQQPVKRIYFGSDQKMIGRFIDQSQRSLSKNKSSSNFQNQPSSSYKQLSNPPTNFNLNSPQNHHFNPHQNYYPSGQYQLVSKNQYESYMAPTDHIVRSHVSNKQSIIANFVDELKSQLQQNEMILQQQKRAHRDTKQKLQGCVQELRMLHLRLQDERGVELVQRQCVRLKGQLQGQIEGRLLLEQRIRQRQLSDYESQTRRRQTYSQFDRELDLMDQIYFNLQATLKL